MPRVKRSVAARKKRRKVCEQASGYWGLKHSSYRRAKVKVTIMFRGRETTHPERGRDLLLRLAEEVKEIGQVESPPLLDGRNMVMMLGPTKNAGAKKEEDAKAEDTQRNEEAVQGDGNGQAPAAESAEGPPAREEVG